MITVNNESMQDKFLEFNIYAEDEYVDIVLSATSMLHDLEDMEIDLDNIKVSTDDGTEICNIDKVIQYAITKDIADINLTGEHTVYVLNEGYDKIKDKLPFTLTENRNHINITGVSEYEKYINLMSKLLYDNPKINIFYSDYIEMGVHYLKRNEHSSEKLPVCMLIYDREYPDDDDISKLLAVIVTNEFNGVNNDIYQVERGV
nr:MAG TPA: hypothetical protein [Caudoviricetes sp.]